MNWVLPRRKTVGFRLFAEALGRCRTRFRWKSQNRKNGYLSPYVEEPLNSKVIKSFVPELRSRKCFCVSRSLCSMYICYEHSMYVSRIRIMGMVQVYFCFEPNLNVYLAKTFYKVIFKRCMAAFLFIFSF